MHGQTNRHGKHKGILDKVAWTTVIFYLERSDICLHSICTVQLHVELICLQDKQTSLMLAVSSGALELTTLFIEAGADVNIRDKV